jgi:hypothetical protein
MINFYEYSLFVLVPSIQEVFEEYISHNFGNHNKNHLTPKIP